MSVNVKPSALNQFADNVLDRVSANFSSINRYVDGYCQGAAGAQNPGSLEPDGSTGAIAWAVDKAAQNLVSNYHEYIAPGAQRLGGTADVLRSSATLYQGQDDTSATRIWTVGQSWRVPDDYHRHHANGGASEFLSGIVDSWSASDHLPKARTKVADTITGTDGVAKWIDDVLAAAGLERFVVDAIKFLIGDYGIPWRNSDAWGNVASAFDGTVGTLRRWGSVLSDQWRGAGGEAFDYDIFERWCPALHGARRVAYASQQQMQALASSWQGVYDLTLDLLDWTAGAVKDAISDAVGLLTRAEELVDLIHTIKVRWDDLMKLGKDVVDMARNIANAATSGWNIKDLYIFQKSPLDTFQHGH